MIPVPMTPTLWAIFILLISNVATGLGWYLSTQEVAREEARVVSCHDERRFFELRVRTAGELAAKAVLVERQKAEQITREVAHGYQTRLDALRANYDSLRKRAAANRANSGGVQSFPVAPADVTEVPADALPLAEQCAETTLMLVELQDWTKQQQEANP